MVASLLITMLTACGSKQIKSASSESMPDALAYNCTSTTDTFTVLTNGGLSKLVVGQLLNEDKKELRKSNNGDQYPASFIYKGKQLRLYYKVTNYSASAKTMYLYLTTDDYLQPFKVDGEAKADYDYSINVPAKSEKYIGFTFEPIELKATGAAVQIYENITNTGSDEYANCANAHNSITLLTQDDTKAITYDYKPNYISTEYDYKGAYSGFALIDTPTRGNLDYPSESTLVNKFKTTDPICVLYKNPHITGDNEKLYLLIDNKLVKAFGGEYCVDIKSQEEKYYEIPIDNSVIPKRGKHTISVFAPYLGDNSNFDIAIT